VPNLAGQLDAAQAEVRRIVIDLDNVDSTLRIFKPDIELDEIPVFRRRVCSRALKTMLALRNVQRVNNRCRRRS
jgi:hypothetical protein